MYLFRIAKYGFLHGYLFHYFQYFQPLFYVSWIVRCGNKKAACGSLFMFATISFHRAG